VKKLKWTDYNFNLLNALINKYRNSGEIAVFDFDNTVICRDIGETTIGQMIIDGSLTRESIMRFKPIEFLYDGSIVSYSPESSLLTYYEKFLLATKHQAHDENYYENAYAFMVKILAGMTPLDIKNATIKTFSNEIAIADYENERSETTLNSQEGSPFYRLPFFYPEMVDLIGNLLVNGLQVFIVSASNVWAIRTMVSILNQKLKIEFGQEIPLKNVIGSSMLLHDEKKQLYKDYPLCLSNEKYEKLEDSVLQCYRLTNEVSNPISTYYGKIAAIFKYIGKIPVLAAGDSINDLPMLAYAKHALFISRLENPEYLHMLDAMAKHYFIIQPTLYQRSAGFVTNIDEVSQRLSSITPEIAESISLLQQFNLCR